MKQKITHLKRAFTRPLSVLLLGSTLLPSCATIISTPMQTVRVVGQPAGSTYFVNDKEVKAKPVGDASGAVRLRLGRKRNAELRVKHEGYKDHFEVLYPDKTNAMTYGNWLVMAGGLYYGATKVEDGSSAGLGYTWLLGVAGFLVDRATGAHKRLNKTEVQAQLLPLPKVAPNSYTVQCGLMNVRVKGGDKMGNFFVRKEAQDVLYFGKTLDVDASNLKTTINSTLKDLGFNVPAASGQSMFATGTNSRFTLQGEMRDLQYNIRASHKYESQATYETSCQTEVTWKLVNQNRQTVFEKKTAGQATKLEKGGSAAFEDAFESSLYSFLGSPEVTAALSKPTGATASTAPADKPEAIVVKRAAPLKLVDSNGISSAAHSVVTINTSDGHGSGCLISADGYLITNAHVVGDEETVKVLFADGIEATGKIIRVNPEMDLALVKVDADGLTGFRLPTASAATSALGTDVYAIGTPADKELGQSITKGIISGRRKIEGHSFLQTDVPINGGNSGGALVTRAGELVGVVNAKLVGRGVEGIGFAIPAEEVSEALQLKFID